MNPGRATLTLYGPVLSDGRDLGPCRVEIAGGQIAAVRPGGPAAGADVVLSGGWLAPGLIDLQVNGAGGVDLTSAADPEGAVAEVARTLVRHGVTAFCPTVISSPEATILRRIGPYGARPHPGAAESLGLHQEGPFINPEHRGAHDPAAIRPPDLAEIDRWLARGRPAIVTLAPELPGALDAIRRLAAAGVAVGLGHSGADAETARAALAAGATLGTHLFNTMPPLHHRRPGLAGALLVSDATLGLIADGVHLDPLIVELVIQAAGPGRVALVSDAAAPAGAPPGRSRLGGAEVVSDGRTVRRPDGTLAGSASLLDRCLRNVRAWLPDLSPAQVVGMATETPARALGPAVAGRKGRIAPGYDADLILIDPQWHVALTIVRGEIVFEAGSTRQFVGGRG